MVPSIYIWVVDQAEQNKGYFTGIKDESTLNIYVKCDSKYDNMMVIEGEVCQNMTIDDNRGGGGHITLQNVWLNISLTTFLFMVNELNKSMFWFEYIVLKLRDEIIGNTFANKIVQWIKSQFCRFRHNETKEEITIHFLDMFLKKNEDKQIYTWKLY